MRSRNIKPGFFHNAELCKLPPLARILFAGLWCLADRRGRLSDNPMWIVAMLLPYSKRTSCVTYLDLLSTSGFIFRYRIGNAKYIQIVNFEKHQNPHVREAESVIPAPEENESPVLSTVLSPVLSTVLAPVINVPSPADSLIPDSLIHKDLKTTPQTPLSLSQGENQSQNLESKSKPSPSEGQNPEGQNPDDSVSKIKPEPKTEPQTGPDPELGMLPWAKFYRSVVGGYPEKIYVSALNRYIPDGPGSEPFDFWERFIPAWIAHYGDPKITMTMIERFRKRKMPEEEGPMKNQK